ncbi:MAG TPA: MG2 domain-containing protein [Kofleriaceae bacterium]
MIRRLATWVAVAALAACQNKSLLDDWPSAARSVSEDKAAAEKGVDAPPKRETLTAPKLSPVIHELGPENAVPTSIVIQMAQPLIDRADVGQRTTKTVLKLTPAVTGTVTYSGVSELTFTPTRPFEFDTTYKVELASVETRDGVLDAPKPDQWADKWAYTFKTPKFAFLGWAPTDLDLAKNLATMEVTFSGAVLPNVARASMTFTIDGKAPASVQVMASHQPNVVSIQLKDPRIKLGAKLGLAIKKDLPSLFGTKLPEAAKAEFQVSSDKAISIKTISVVEGATGFYVEVVCDDKAAEDGHRSWYEGEGYHNLSQRCQLADASRISFSPAVKKVYVTSSRAGFRIFGDFKRGVYKLKIAGGATSVDGGVLLSAYNRTFSVSARKPQLSFAASGRYLPRTAWNNLGIKHLNTEAVNLVVRHVPAENLVFWLGNDSSEIADERTSNVILKKEIPLRANPDENTTSWIDVGTLLPRSTKGVLELRLAGVGANATSRLLLTNMSLVAKKTPVPDKPWQQRVQVWALDMDTNELLGDVEVTLVRKSGKTVARCTTSSGSGCTMATKDDADPDQAEPFALIARRGEDLTYIRYRDLRADVVESSTSGVPYVASTPYRGTVFSDRGVYRPGDTAHITAIVRDGKDKAPDLSLPVDVKLVDPRAKVVKKLTLKTNAAGVISFDHVLPAFADTGHWRVAMTVADKPLAAYDLQVEEFVPERMKVQLSSKVEDALVGAKLSFDVAARYLFGGSAVDSGVELTCSIEPTSFAPVQNADLTYGVAPKGKAVSLGEPERGQLDPAGRLAITCPEPEEDTTFTQTGELTATASVLEAGSGRATVKTATVTLHPEKYYLGVRTKAVRAKGGETFQVEGMVVDWAGKPLTASIKQVQIELVQLQADYSYGYDDDSGESRYDRWLREVPEGKATAKVEAGKFVFDVTPGEAHGGYLVRVKAGKARTDLILDGEYSYDYYDDYGGGGNNRYDATPRPAKPTQLKLDLPKEIKVGESVTAKIKTPYRGKVLWTVETDHVVSAEWRDVTSAEASWTFKLNEFAPNVYVSAFLVKDPHLESRDAFMPDRAYGVKSTRVSPIEFTQNVKLEAPREIRSSSPLQVKLDLGPTAAGTVAVVAIVDEGILQLTNFQTPDPLSQLFAKRALGVETYETLGWTMLHQPAGASSKTGGGDYEEDAEGAGGALDAGRVQPVKPVALFSGVMPVGPDGKLTIPFHVPTYRGELRVMAITAGPTKIGRAEAKVTVKDPLVIQVTFPRFVTQGDQMQIPVFMTNLSGGPLEVQVTLGSSAIPIAGIVQPKSAPAPLTFAGKDNGNVKIMDGLAETLVFRANANMPVGGAKLRVVAKAKGKAGTFEVADEVDVPFLPSGPKDRTVQKVKLTAGKLDLAAQPALKNWMPLSEKTTFWVTSNPYGESFDHLRYLIRYPYGCIEQTSSTLRPLLYVGGIVEQIDPELAQLKIEDMVLSGINRILSMETPSGGFGYWPGSTEPVEWGTAYATHILIDAKKAGYSVPDDRLQAVLTWIENRAAERESGKHSTAGWHHYDEQAETYLHYVLALSGKGKKARILKLIEQIPVAKATGEQLEDLYMLKAALYLAGDRRYAADLKQVDASPVTKDRVNYWSFYSDRRRRGLQLSTFHDLFGNDPAGEPLANRVAEMLTAEKNSYYYNTQELVWGITGLGKWVKSIAGKGTADGTLTADGTVIQPRKMKLKTNDKSWSLQRASEYKQLSLDVPAAANGMWLVITSEGVRPNGIYKVGGNGMTVSRTYRDFAGDEIDLTKGELQLGEVAFVEIEVANTTGQQIQNIALVDRLPAGFEVENPRLGRGFKADWIEPDDQWALDFLNMRDDRLEAFGMLPAGASKKVVYSVRAVTSGTYTVPPVDVEAMYDPTLWAREAGGKAVIGGPWTGKLL